MDDISRSMLAQSVAQAIIAKLVANHSCMVVCLMAAYVCPRCVAVLCYVLMLHVFLVTGSIRCLLSCCFRFMLYAAAECFVMHCILCGIVALLLGLCVE